MPSSGRVTLLVLALLLPVAAGCIGGGDSASGTPPANHAMGNGSPSRSGGQAADAAGTPVAFDLDAPVQETVWANGTFQAHEACYPAGCPAGVATHTIELASQLPQDAPVILAATLTYEQGASVLARPIEAAVSSESATFYTFENQAEPGQQTIQATLMPGDGPMLVQVTYRGATGQTPPEAYTLRIDIASNATVLPPGVPVALEGLDATNLTLQPVGDGPVQARLYDASDQLAAELSGQRGPMTLSLPAPGTQPPVLLLAESSQPVRVLANDTEARFVPLTLEVEVLEGQDVVGPQAVTWSFEVQGHPLEAGLYMTEGQEAMATLEEGRGSLASPVGTLAEGELGCGVCLTSGFLDLLDSPVGDPALVPGTYEASYEPGGSVGAQVGGYLVWYQR